MVMSEEWFDTRTSFADHLYGENSSEEFVNMFLDKQVSLKEDGKGYETKCL